MSKLCKKCNIEKPVAEFHKNKAKKDGYDYKCKECAQVESKQLYAANKEARKLNSANYYNKNKEIVLEKMKIYADTNKEARAERGKKWYNTNKEKISEQRKIKHLENREQNNERKRNYHAQNREKLNQKSREYAKANVDKRREYKKKWRENNRNKLREQKMERYYFDDNYRLKHNLSNRMRLALHGADKSSKTMELLGCDIDFLHDYIEAEFTPEMTWENYGTYWQVDHIRPCASFDLTDPAQQKICFHWSNLQPLKAIENQRKGAKIIE